METKRVQKTTVLLKTINLILVDNMDEKKSTLVRVVDRVHIENIKSLMKGNPTNFTTSFVFVVEPENCLTIAEWDPAKNLEWRYRVIGGITGQGLRWGCIRPTGGRFSMRFKPGSMQGYRAWILQN